MYLTEEWWLPAESKEQQCINTHKDVMAMAWVFRKEILLLMLWWLPALSSALQSVSVSLGNSHFPLHQWILQTLSSILQSSLPSSNPRRAHLLYREIEAIWGTSLISTSAPILTFPFMLEELTLLSRAKPSPSSLLPSRDGEFYVSARLWYPIFGGCESVVLEVTSI